MEYTEKDEASMKMKLDGDHQDDEGKGRCKKPKTMYEATRGFRTRMRGPFYIAEENQKEWQWDLGTEALSEIWAMGYRGLEDLEKGFSPGTPHEFLRQLELEDRRIEIRTKTLRAQQERRLQMERAAREKIEKADREAKEKEVRAIKETGDVEMNDAKDAESTKVLKKEDADVEMKPPETNSALTMKTEVSPQPIPIHVSDQTSRASTPSRTSIHPSLPPKPGSRAVSPVKAATPVPSIPTLTTSPSSALTAAPSAAIPIATKTTVAATPTPAPTLPALPQDEQIRKAEESKTRITWLALRTTRDSAQGYLVHFNKIGAGDLKMLCEEIGRSVGYG
ncbi:hypothetical protein F5050DRAFT_296419 [Lentinula boryana]|uniref:Uncharacterized protein n=1 Tax=Lentinula boryana TaxID=40481 RepID=A0ABQ8QAE4_9AGAR|nr:hypothetical protein F5050DRAFT_296419 [Lentinula boryana]